MKIDLSLPDKLAKWLTGYVVSNDEASPEMKAKYPLREGKVQVREISPALVRYASLFNARDWDGVRALLADEVKLDLVSRRKAAGRREVGSYFSNYASVAGWRLIPAWLDGREVLAVLPDANAVRPRYFVELGWRSGQVVAIRDFRYVPYIAQDEPFELTGSDTCLRAGR